MRFARPISLAASLVMLPLPSGAQPSGGSRWSIELFGGSAVSAPAPLTVRQDGYPDFKMTAHYATRPWLGAPYYAVRIGRWTRGHAWELELVHHKLYLTNPPSEIQHFEVSHGYNLITVNRAARYRGLIVRAGAGAVALHPEATVRGQPLTRSSGNLGGGYFIAGLTAQLAAEKRFALWRGLTLGAEAKLTGSYARFSGTGGGATVPNAALHGLLGLGWEM